MSPSQGPPRVLTIAGSDSGGGAGIQADLKAFAAHGVYGASVVTAVTAQNTRSVTRIEAVSPAMIGAQIDAVFEDIRIDAVKIGMIGDDLAIAAIADRLAGRGGLPIVVDPVMVAKSGTGLLAPDSTSALVGRIFPLATLITPNAPEAERLSGVAVADEESQERAARKLVGSGPAVLVKGGHLEGGEIVDLLLAEEVVYRYVHQRIATSSTHGTGCTLSSAIAARLALGDTLPEAVRKAIEFVQGAIAAAYPVGGGHGPVDPLFRLYSR